MSDLPKCPKCNFEYTYEDKAMYVCPECGNEWLIKSQSDPETQIVDSNGNVLSEGDTITVIKNLKVKGTSSVVKLWYKDQEYSFS